MTSQDIEKSSAPSQQDIKHVESLKQQALQVIQNLAADTWTDHNNGDPGITILEVLAFVITDLSHRLAYPMVDLLTPDPEGGEQPAPFFMGQQILPSNPVTLNDHRRFFMDIDGVKNADIKRRKSADGSQRASGVFDIIIDFEDYLSQASAEHRERIQSEVIAEVRRRFISQRNVNEDIGAIRIINKQPVAVAISLSLQVSADPQVVIGELLNRVQEVIAPTVRSYRYDEMQALGLSGDRIFNGPLLSQGFVLEEDVEKLSMPSSLFASDIISTLTDIAGLKTLQGFKFLSQQEGGDLLWRMDILPNSITSLDLATTYAALEVEIDGQRYDLPALDQSQLTQLIKIKTLQPGNGMPEYVEHYIDGQYRHLSQYRSLQHQLPAIYGLSEQRLNDPALSTQTAQILQLKGYLSLFDQVLADQYAQLDSLKTLLALPSDQVFARLAKNFNQMLASETMTSKDITQFWCDVKKLPITQLSQPLQDISGMGRLLGNYVSQYAQDGFQSYAEEAFGDLQLDRLKRSCEHLFARFAETTLDASLLKYRDVFSHYLSDLRRSPDALVEQPHEPLINKLVSLKQIVDLVLLLKQYSSLSKLRTGGFDYLNADPKSSHAGGLSQRIMRFLGISKSPPMPLATNNKEGFYLLESELIRFGAEQESYGVNQLYFVAPNWPTRFANDEFRNLLERQIVKDSPVYQQPNILYLNRQDMSLFERLYFSWLNAMTQLPLVSGMLSDEPEPGGMEVASELTAAQELAAGKQAQVENLSALLREFFKEGASFFNIILKTIALDQLALTLALWLDAGEVAQLATDSVENMRRSLHKILLARSAAPADASAHERVTNDLFTQILFTVCQAQLDALVKPLPIAKATIGSNFRLGYRKLHFLKPAYPTGNAVINPTAMDDAAAILGMHPMLADRPAFTLGIKQPFSI
ncbi:MAG: hypothetical protein RPR40_04480 [Bermanella sp.]|jgi:hypothetical protein